jgi:GNAT superfamily N-acetyltransferase
MPDCVPACSIRPYRPEDRDAVIDLFVRVNRDLAPPALRTVFEAYVERSLQEEMARIAEYYDAGRKRSFWVATDGARLLGNFGLEPTDDRAVEIRRMYVDFAFRRSGIARAMLAHAEERARDSGFERIILSTSSLQLPALALYRSAGYELLREEIATEASLKTIGNGIRRFYLEKWLSHRPAADIQPAGPH